MSIGSQSEVGEVDDGRGSADRIQHGRVVAAGLIQIRRLHWHGVDLIFRNRGVGKKTLAQMGEVAVLVPRRSDALVHLDDMHIGPGHFFVGEVPEHLPRGAPPAYGHDKASTSGDGGAGVRGNDLCGAGCHFVGGAENFLFHKIECRNLTGFSKNDNAAVLDVLFIAATRANGHNYGMSFQNLGLPEPVLHGAQRMGYSDATPIQLRAIPVILSGRDLVASAQTGTGKTAAFALPVLAKLDHPEPRIRCLVLEPTRELAMQVETAFRDYMRFMHTEVTLIHGGVGYGKQRDDLKRHCDVVVATPGRLLDHMQQGLVDLSSLQFLILDEVDRMLDMGFLPDVRRIVEQCPKERQTLLFSATIPEEIQRLSAWCLKDPERIEIGARRSPAETVSHALYPVAADQKFDLLLTLLERTNYDSVLIFSRTKDGADRISRQLKKNNHSVATLHSNRTQTERVDALEGFKGGRYEVMVATDIAARGIDIAGVSHVINYDVPQHPEDYVHRIGRTGRAQTVGEAFTIMTAEELPHVLDIERFIGQKVPRLKIENFNYVYTALFNEDSVLSSLKGAKGVRTHKGMRFGAKRKR